MKIIENEGLHAFMAELDWIVIIIFFFAWAQLQILLKNHFYAVFTTHQPAIENSPNFGRNLSSQVVGNPVF